MIHKGKFIIGKSKYSRLSLEQRILGLNRQFTKLLTKVDLICTWISPKFGVTFMVEASDRVKDVSKHISLVKSTAQRSRNAGVWKTKHKPQNISASGGQSGSDVSTESDGMVELDSDVNEADKDAETATVGFENNLALLEGGDPERGQKPQIASDGQDSGSDVSTESDTTVDSDSDVHKADKNAESIVRESVDGQTPLEEREGQRKSKNQRNKEACLQVGANMAQDGNVTKGSRPRQTAAERNFQAPNNGPQKHSCNWLNCNKCFNYKSRLVEHQRTHPGLKPFKCQLPNCGKSFSLSGNLTIHRRTHTGEKPYLCNWPNCGKSFSQSSTLQIHRRTHTDEQPFKVGICDHLFASSSGLATHFRVYTETGTMGSKDGLASLEGGDPERHQKPQSVSGRLHSGSDSDVSTESDTAVDSDSDSNINEADKNAETSVREPVDGPIPLEDGEPEREGCIPRHRKSKVQRKKMARLQVGPNRVGQGGNGTKEQEPPRRTLAPVPHKRRQKHSCNWPHCNKNFSYNSNLVRHHRTHTGEKPFKCTWPNCGKSFSRSDDRTIHRRTHTGERPFHCGFCGHRFASSSEVASHSRVHTGVKPYKCRVCAATFTYSIQKVRHEKIHH